MNPEDVVPIASLTVSVVSLGFTALGYFTRQRSNSTKEDHRLATATRRWTFVAGAAVVFVGLWFVADQLGRVKKPITNFGYLAGTLAALAAAVLRHRKRTRSLKQMTVGLLRDESLGPNGELLRVSRVNPYKIGVSLSNYADGGKDPYIARPEVDTKVDDEIRKAVLGSSQLIVLRGKSKAGKSRLAYEAVRRQLPDAHLVVPEYGTIDKVSDFVPLTEKNQTVMWLDELDRYLVGPAQANALMKTLSKARGRLLVIATITTKRYLEGFVSSPTTTPGIINPLSGLTDPSSSQAALSYDLDVRRLIDHACFVDVPSKLSDEELPNARELYPHEDFSRGPGELFVAAREHDSLYATCPDADPICWALIRAAIDWRRMGISQAIPRSTLIRLARCYLPFRGRDAFPDDERVNEGLDKAQDLPEKSPAKALEQVSDQPEPAYDAFDYLVECVSGRSQPALPIPEKAWLTLVEIAPLEELLSVARAANKHRVDDSVRRSISDRLLGAEQLEFRAAGHLIAGVLDGARDLASSEQHARQALEAGSPDVRAVAIINLASLAYKRGDLEEAERWYRQGVEAGSRKAMAGLGWLFLQRGDPEEAERWYGKAAEVGDATAMAGLGWLFLQRGDPEEAERWYGKAAEAGDATAMTNLGSFAYNERGDLEEAERWYGKAAEAGDVTAMANLGRLFYERGDTEEAERWYVMAAEAGDARALTSLGWLFYKRGDLEESERWYSKAAEAGDAKAMTSLGGLFLQRGDLEESERWYGKAAEAGDPKAMARLGWLFYERGDLEESERWYGKAAEAGHAGAMTDVGWFVHERGDLEEAERWYRRAAEAGDAGGLTELGRLAEERGDLEEAERLYGEGAEAGDATAMANLGRLFYERGDLKGAQGWYSRAAEARDAET